MFVRKILSTKSKKTAIILSYVSLVLNTLSSIFLTRVLLKILGADEYGLYQMIYSVASYVMLFDMGISTVMTRYMSEYRAKGDSEGERNIAGIVGIIAAAAALLIAIICLIVRNNIGHIYSSLTPEEVATSKTMMSFMTIQFVLTIYSHYQKGAIHSKEYFAYGSVTTILNTVFVFAITVLFSYLGFGCVGIAIAHLIAVMITVAVDGIMLYGVIRFKPCLKHWDTKILKPIAGLMAAMLLQSIIGYVNTYVDKTLLGMFCTKIDVTLYSLAATILTMFNTIPGVISGLFQPKITTMIVKNASPAKLTDEVIRVGRWQFMLLGAVLGAFALFGRNFITIWAGEEYALTAWIIAMIIMIPNTVPLIQSVCISILNGYDKRIYRSMILICMTGVNIIISIVLIKQYGAIGAPIGTAISYILGNGFVLNLYYSKSLHLEIKRMFSCILKGTWITALITTVVCSAFLLIPALNIWIFLVECIVFVLIYSVLQYKIGMNPEEKQVINVLFRRFLHIKTVNDNIIQEEKK